MNFKEKSVLLALSIALASASDAAIILGTNITVSASGSGSNASSGSNVNRLIDGSGLSAPLTDGNLSTITHTNGFDGSSQYLTQNTTGSSVIVTFTISGQTATDRLDTLAIWNYTQTGGADQLERSADSVDISIAHAGGTFNSSAFSLSAFDGSTPLTSDTFDTSSLNLFGVTSVALTLNEASSTNLITGLSEVAFQTSTIPEPSSSALLGLAGLALILRRRK